MVGSFAASLVQHSLHRTSNPQAKGALPVVAQVGEEAAMDALGVVVHQVQM